MILVDYSQVSFAQISLELARPNRPNGVPIDEDFIRHKILNQIRYLNVKFRDQYGQMLLIMDSGNNWRKEFFNLYKANRKIARDKSLVDWDVVFQTVGKVAEEIRINSSFQCVKVDRAEADDIIGAICKLHASKTSPILIISSDKDFKQLQAYPNVRQYRPTTEEYIKETDPKQFLKELIVRGDGGDGVPNVLSDLDSIVNGKRASVMSGKRLNTLLSYFDLDSKNKIVCNISCPEDMKKRLELNDMMVNIMNIDENPTIGVPVVRAINAAVGVRKEAPNPIAIYLMSVGCKQLATKPSDFVVRYETVTKVPQEVESKEAGVASIEDLF